MSSLKSNFEKIKKELGPDVTLVAVSKYGPVDDILAAYKLGQRDFGENRVQDLKIKAQELKHLKDIRWHFIGHIQSNKLATLLKVPHLKAIHSLDSLNVIHKLVDQLRRLPFAELKKKGLKVFLQINTSGEDEKYGLDDGEEIDLATQDLLRAHENQLICFEGLMTMGTLRTEAPSDEARRCFRHLKQLAAHLGEKYAHPMKLSMGMSGDYSIAVKEGANYVRIGSKLFK